MVNNIPRLIAQVEPDEVSIITTTSDLEQITQLKPSFYLTTALNLLLGAAGVFSFIYLLWGGVQWVTAGGDKDAVEKARKKIIGALIGLAIVFSSYAILLCSPHFVQCQFIQVPLSPLGSSASAQLVNRIWPGSPGCRTTRQPLVSWLSRWGMWFHRASLRWCRRGLLYL